MNAFGIYFSIVVAAYIVGPLVSLEPTHVIACAALYLASELTVSRKKEIKK